MNRQGQGPTPIQYHPLFGKFDQDPGAFRPQWYHVDIDVPVTLGGTGRGQIRIDNEPYALFRITHKIVGDIDVPSESGLYQNGMYSVEWSDEKRRYTDGAINADLMWGWNTTGYIIDFPYPIAYAGSKSIEFIITNNLARTLVPTADYFKVEIVLHGIADLGELQSRSAQ